LNPDLVDRFSARKRKKKAKKARRTVADVLDPLDLPTMIVAALRVVASSCSYGRDAQDRRLWDLAKALKQAKSADSVAQLLFDVGAQHGANGSVRALRNLAQDPNAYASFCGLCGLPLAEHGNDCTCKDKPVVVDTHLLDGIPGAAEVIEDDEGSDSAF